MCVTSYSRTIILLDMNKVTSIFPTWVSAALYGTVPVESATAKRCKINFLEIKTKIGLHDLEFLLKTNKTKKN